MKSKKRYLIFAGLVALLVLTGVLNYYFNNNNSQMATTDPDTSQALDEETAAAASRNFFTSFRSERENSRTQEIAFLDAVINNDATDADTLKEAQQQKIEISKAMEKEVTIEGLVKAKGFTDVVVTIQSGSVNVVVDSEKLEDAQVAQILDIVKTESGASSDNIKVIPKS